MPFHRRERNGKGKAMARAKRPGMDRSSPKRNARRSSGAAGGATIGPIVGGPISGVQIRNGTKYRLTDAAGRQYTWSRTQLDDTLFESSTWDSSAMRRKVHALKPGQKITRSGETLELLGRNARNMAKKRAVGGKRGSGLDFHAIGVGPKVAAELKRKLSKGDFTADGRYIVLSSGKKISVGKALNLVEGHRRARAHSPGQTTTGSRPFAKERNMAKKRRRTQRNLSTSEAREKIRKLISLAEDRGDAPEGRLAMGKARAIAKKYGLESELGRHSTALARPSPRRKAEGRPRKETEDRVRKKASKKRGKKAGKKTAKKAGKKRGKKIAKRTSSAAAPARKAPRRRRRRSRAGLPRKPSVCIKPSQGITATQADAISRAVEAALGIADRPPTPARRRRKKGSATTAVATRASSAAVAKPKKKRSKRKPCPPGKVTKAQVARAACIRGKARWDKSGKSCKPKVKLPNAKGKRTLQAAAAGTLAKARWDKVCRNFNNVNAELM